MAEALEERKGSVERPARQKSLYGNRFLLAYLLVMAVFGGMVVLFAVLVSQDDSSGQTWSAYKPSGRDQFDKAQNMVNFVAPRYVHQGVPIAVVEAQPLIVQDRQVDGIAITQAPLRELGRRYRQFERADQTMLYVFCGQGNRCSFPQAGAEDVLPLLQRESLEFALYTFKYWPDINSIVAMLPPTKSTQLTIFLKRENFEKELSQPLNATLPARALHTADSMSLEERATVDRLTSNSIFRGSFQEIANGRTLLLLGSGSP